MAAAKTNNAISHDLRDRERYFYDQNIGMWTADSSVIPDSSYLYLTFVDLRIRHFIKMTIAKTNFVHMFTNASVRTATFVLKCKFFKVPISNVLHMTISNINISHF